jgi:hypothetical protein
MSRHGRHSIVFDIEEGEMNGSSQDYREEERPLSG